MERNYFFKHLSIGAGLALAAGVAMADTPPDLLGQVLDSAGRPVASASVFIYTAGPRFGPGYI